nr:MULTISPECIES: glycosyltransferase family 4 protein [unclassified Dietzia]
MFFRICANLNIRTVLHVHGSLVSGLVGKGALSRAWATKGILAAGEVVVLDGLTQREIHQITGRLPIKVPNFVDGPTSSVKSSPGTGSVLYVGRVSKEKGSDTLVRIASTLGKRTGLTVVGPIDPAINREFRASCDKLNVVLLGEVESEAVIGYMEASDLLVLPSHHEGFPMVVLEAMALGLPVIASDVGACREMLEEGSEPAAGVVLRNPILDGGDDFVRVVADLVADPSRLKDLNGGKERVLNHYTAAHVIPRMLSVMKGV